MVDEHQDDNDYLIQIYWRPGCPYCDRLLRALGKANVVVNLRNIWEDDEARIYVRAHNNGNETVPTVAYNGQVLTNPTPGEVLKLIAGS